MSMACLGCLSVRSFPRRGCSISLFGFIRLLGIIGQGELSVYVTAPAFPRCKAQMRSRRVHLALRSGRWDWTLAAAQHGLCELGGPWAREAQQACDSMAVLRCSILSSSGFSLHSSMRTASCPWVAGGALCHRMSLVLVGSSVAALPWSVFCAVILCWSTTDRGGSPALSQLQRA